MPIENSPREALRKRLRPCPFCGRSLWGADLEPVVLPAFENDSEGRLKVITEFQDDGAELPGVAAIPAVCGVCGYVALFHVSSLLADLPAEEHSG
jgi:hypothetical protein